MMSHSQATYLQEYANSSRFQASQDNLLNAAELTMMMQATR